MTLGFIIAYFMYFLISSIYSFIIFVINTEVSSNEDVVLPIEEYKEKTEPILTLNKCTDSKEITTKPETPPKPSVFAKLYAVIW
jgi:hypothetical protein